MDPISLMRTMLDVLRLLSITILSLILCIVLICILIALLFLLSFVLLHGLTIAFSYSGADVWQILEYWFQSSNQKGLLTIASLIAKFQTSKDDMSLQMFYLQGMRKLVTESTTLVQREVYISGLIERYQEGEGDLPRAPEVAIWKLQQELKSLSTKLQGKWWDIKSHTLKYPGGAWVREDERKPPIHKRRDESLACRARGGCCAFGCGCCEKIRSFRNVPKERPAVFLYSHCTNECACCYRRDCRSFAPDKSLFNEYRSDT
ncbi:hypothetical protein N7495_009057 [Penicillium taxi]|uniref:uncharacterized protein n=1 Tax=Penicillium taxi TaxID=168475 RepID=UPI002544EC99|nr:uncharacterized protein N7495_009057 [Penicillium taxi]KAJ5889016.1 hypothetical protein N7495_009057 [Penicillium taxi]